MKWSIAGLLLLGIGAAISASILVATLKVGAPALASTSLSPAEMQIMVAAKPMPAMSIVDARSVLTKTVPANEAPANSMRRPTDVIGKLLTVPIVEGQVLTSTCFADEKSGARLASALVHGMRAVSVSLTPDKAGLLYAGCIVDVLVSLNRPSTEGAGTKEAMSMTLLQGVEVLAIDETSVMSEAPTSEASAAEAAANTRRGRRDRLVTLMVNSNQAKALQLASQYGAVSLALRNPLDTAPVKTDSTMLSGLADEYTRIVAALSPPQSGEPKADDPGRAANPAQHGPGPQADRAEQYRAALTKAEREQRAEDKAPLPAGMLVAQKLEDPKWEMLVNRGGQLELLRFRRPGELSPQDTTQWIWDSRAFSGTNANPKEPR